MSIDLRVRPRVPATPATPAPTTGVLLIQSAKGLQRKPWSTDKEQEVREVEHTFSELRQCGYRGYKLDSTTHVHEEITRFDPTAKEVVMIMPLRGGAR